MTEGVIDATGALVSEITPAVYFDASVLIDYWMGEGMECEPDPDFPPLSMPHEVFVRELLKVDKRVAGMLDVRKALLFEPLQAHAVSSSLALLELIEWYAESGFKNIAAGVAGAKAIQRLSKKDVGACLKRVLEARSREIELDKDSRQNVDNGLKTLREETFIVPSFLQAHGLAGVVVVDVVGFSFKERDAWDVPQIFAYLQMGMADIIHLLVAKHIGCTWIASFDSDFAKCRQHIKDGLGMSLLTTPEEIRAVLLG